MPDNAPELPGETQRRADRRRAQGAASPPPGSDLRDSIAIEEPLEIRVEGLPLAVTMRTPGEDDALAAGYCLAEGIVQARAQVGVIETDGSRYDTALRNVVDLRVAPGVHFALEALQTARRGTLTTAACGVCGRRSIDDLLARCRPLDDARQIATAAIFTAMRALREHQPLFAHTGGVHAAAAFDAAGGLLACAEDVGRHNAMDKVIGRLLLDGRLESGHAKSDRDDLPLLLAVSGRASFELVQKAVMARIPVLASVSAASSLAIDLALKSGLTLAAFVRDERLTLYTHPNRVI